MSVIGDGKRYGSNLRGLHAERISSLKQQLKGAKLSIGGSSLMPSTKARDQHDSSAANDANEADQPPLEGTIDATSKEQQQPRKLPKVLPQKISAQPQMRIMVDVRE